MELFLANGNVLRTTGVEFTDVQISSDVIVLHTATGFHVDN